MLWFSALTRLNRTLEGEEINIAKYQEVVNMAIARAFSMPFGGSHTAYVHVTTVATVLHKTHVNKEMKGWRMEGRPVLLPFVGGDASWNPCKPHHHFTQKRCIVYPYLLPFHRREGNQCQK